jgi:hypothetical protein
MLLYLAKWFRRRSFIEIDQPETRIAYVLQFKFVLHLVIETWNGGKFYKFLNVICFLLFSMW